MTLTHRPQHHDMLRSSSLHAPARPITFAGMPRFASLSLERKLPLLISVFLVALAVGLTAAGYHEVRQASEMRGIERMRRLTGQLAELSNASTQQRFAALRRVAADSSVIASLASPGDNPGAQRAALRALRGLSIAPSDSVLVAEVRSASETRRIATRPELGDDGDPVATLIDTLARGQAAMGNLYRRGDSAFYWVGAPVTANGRILGYVMQRRMLGSSPRTQQQLRDLAGGDSVTIYIASDSGDTWVSLTGKPTPLPTLEPHAGDPPNVVRYTRTSPDERFVGVFARVANTPIRLIAEVPYASLLERPRAYLQRSIMVAFGLLVVGIIAAWLLSRRITRPIRDLTIAGMLCPPATTITALRWAATTRRAASPLHSTRWPSRCSDPTMTWSGRSRSRAHWPRGWKKRIARRPTSSRPCRTSFVRRSTPSVATSS